MYFVCVALFLWFLFTFYYFSGCIFKSFQYFFGFSYNFIFFITFFVISQVVINNIIERVFVLYISTFILCCILLDRSNIFSINNIKITRLKFRLWFLILFKIFNMIFSVLKLWLKKEYTLGG